MHMKMDIFKVIMSGCWIKVREICEVHVFEILKVDGFLFLCIHGCGRI
ncbi:hypothetical protein AMTRI_Chr11g95760 [Amborella trichopoda]